MIGPTPLILRSRMRRRSHVIEIGRPRCFEHHVRRVLFPAYSVPLFSHSPAVGAPGVVSKARQSTGTEGGPPAASRPTINNVVLPGTT